jgi:hypothetical protein
LQKQGSLGLVYGHEFGPFDSLCGLSVFRSYGNEDEFIKGLTVYHDGHQYPERLFESNYNAEYDLIPY